MSVVGQVGRLIWDPLKDSYVYYKNYKRNVMNVDALANRLEGLRNDIEAKRKDLEHEELQELTNDATNWLSEANSILYEDGKLKKIINYHRSYDEHSTCPGPDDLYHRYKYSKQAKKLSERIENHNNIFPTVFSRSIPIDVAATKITEYLSFDVQSRTGIMEKILDKLTKDDQVYVVGLFGNALVGKTKMAKDVTNNERVRSSFGKRVIVDVSETPNKKDIQDKIIGGIANKELGEIENVGFRAWMLYYYIHYHEEENILIVLDGMWKKLNLLSLGISPAKGCKVLVISRMKDVCEGMGAKEEDIFELNPLTLEEEKIIFWKQIYQDRSEMLDHLTSGDYMSLGNKLLKNCRGSPHAVVAIAKVLKGQSLLQWRGFANELETKKHHEVFDSIWDKNLELLNDNKEKKLFFLLTCLFPRESSIPIQELMTYAMGIDLLQWADNLTQAIAQANTWVHELISTSLLEPDDDMNNKAGQQLVNVFVPRLVQKRAISLLANEEHNFLVKSIPRWHTEEKCQNYTAISLMPGQDHSRLSNFNSNKLQILILDNSLPRDHFADNFFQGMTKLKVLVLKRMLLLHLPNSKGLFPEQLRLLRLEDCTLRTIDGIDGLVNLVVLSLRGSEMEEFPGQLIKNCDKLRLLDLSKCTIKNDIGIPADVLGNLLQLEGLYAYDCFDNWATENHETGSTKSAPDFSKGNATARISELNNMKYLNVLEMKVRDPCQFPIEDDQFTKNLNQFRVFVGLCHEKSTPGLVKGLCRVLEFQSIKVSSISQYSCVRGLLKRSEMLKLVKVEKLQQLICHMDRFNFQNLQILEITKCHQMRYFSHTPFKAPNLSDLKVVSCTDLRFFFETLERSYNKGEDDIIEFPNLKVMMLDGLENLGTVLSESNCTSTTNTDDIQVKERPYQTFFHTKVTFPNLEELELCNVGNFVNLCDVKCKDRGYFTSFKKLDSIVIWKCAKLEGLFSFAIAATLELKDLTILECEKLKSIIAKEEEKEDDKLHQLFPSLEKVSLEKCPLLQFFITGTRNHQVLELPHLQTMEITECQAMQAFSSTIFTAPSLNYLTVDSCPNLNFFFHTTDPVDRVHIEYPKLTQMFLSNLQKLKSLLSESNCTSSNSDLQGKGHQYQAFFHRKITFPMLEELGLLNVGEIVTLWDFMCKEPYYISSFQNLEAVEIQSCAKLEVLASFAIAAALEQLKILMIVDCSKMKSVFEKTENEALHQQLFPSLENVTLKKCPLLEHFIVGSQNQVVELLSLQTLEIRECPKMQAFPSTILMAPNLQNLETMLSNCTTSNSDLQGKGHQYQVFFQQKFKFRNLKELDLENIGAIMKLWDVKCKKKDYISQFKNLTKIVIRSCPKLEGLASFAIAAMLEKLKELVIVDCPQMKSAITKEKTEKEIRQQQLFPSLEKLALEQCPVLQFFIAGTQDQVLELSSLQTLAITKCPEMQALSSAIIKAPKLCVTVDELNPNPEIQDINSFLHNYYQNLHKPSGESLEEEKKAK